MCATSLTARCARKASCSQDLSYRSRRSSSALSSIASGTFLSVGKFIGFASQDNSPFVGIPVFPSRVFRHSGFYVRADRGIAAPKDLEGKTVGIPEWAQTAGIYARGFLAETAGVDLRKTKWVQAGTNEAGREEKVEFTLPKGILYQQRRDTSLSALLLSGEIDAAISARVPEAYYKGKGKVVRLYPNYCPEEMRYFAATGIFPIMHTSSPCAARCSSAIPG